MLAKCSNPSCVAQFLHLGDGRLFRLISVFDSGRLEYFWLCNSCSSSMILRLAEAGSVVAVPLPKTIENFSDEVDHVSFCREKGLLLRSVFRSGESAKAREGTRWKVGHDAA
jgi:hypothetical protein